MPMVAFPTFLTTALDPYYIASLKEKAYILDTGNLAVKFANGDQLAVWFKNESLTDDLIYMYSASSWNGGDTNHNRGCIFRGRFDIAVPTANFIAKPPAPANGYNVTPAPLTSYVWDGVGAGITVADMGIVGVTSWLAQGTSEFGPHSGVIIPPGGIAGCSFEPEEDGHATDEFFLVWVPHNRII